MSAIDNFFNQNYVNNRIATAKARAARDLPVTGSQERKALAAERTKAVKGHWSYDANAHRALVENTAPISQVTKKAA